MSLLLLVNRQMADTVVGHYGGFPRLMADTGVGRYGCVGPQIATGA